MCNSVLPGGALLLVLLASQLCYAIQDGALTPRDIPPSWEVLPIPRYVDYGSPDDFVVLGNVAIVRKDGGPYQTVRDEQTELVGDSTITEEELIRILGENGVTVVESVPDNLASYDGYDTLILLGSPRHNAQTVTFFKTMNLSFNNWDDPNTSEDDFTDWPDLGKEGYVLKVGRAEGMNAIILAGYDFDAAAGRFHGAGTFYAMQSLRQLIVVENDVVKVKTAEIADKPLVAIRGALSGWSSDPQDQWRAAAVIPRMKENQNIWWYGNGLVAYNVEAASKFRYPWRPEQLEFIAKVGKYCRERYVTMVFCMNPDHFQVDWAAAKTFDGARKDPLHYDPDHEVEAPFKEMWARLGYEVRTDVDILAAKFAQLDEAVPGCVLQVMNEDDVFGLVHEQDKRLFKTDTGDAAQDAANYGRARAKVLAALHARIRELRPDSNQLMPLCPPDGLCYQLVLETNEFKSREFLSSMCATLQELGVGGHMPLITTGGGTAAEVVTGRNIDDFADWARGAPVILFDNNNTVGHIGAYETDPNGPRFALQVNKDYPAGFRDRELYKRVVGVQWNGFGDESALAWCQAQFMWNMLALDRQKVNALATRKVACESFYPWLKSLYEEFDLPPNYYPDNPPPFRILVISNRIAFPSKSATGPDAWVYDIRYPDDMRRECQRLRDKLNELKPHLASAAQTPMEAKRAESYPQRAYAFCSLYLAYGYLRGWEKDTDEGKLVGTALRDLYLEAEDIQQRFFAGPAEVPNRPYVFWRGMPFSAYTPLAFLYNDGRIKTMPETPAQSDVYTDIWEEGLEGRFFEPVRSVSLSAVGDEDSRLASGWGAVEEAEGEAFRSVDSKGVLNIRQEATGRLLVRVRIGAAAAPVEEGVRIRLSTVGAAQEDAVARPRWINWLLPEGKGIHQLVIGAERPVRVHSVEVYREKSSLGGNLVDAKPSW